MKSLRSAVLNNKIKNWQNSLNIQYSIINIQYSIFNRQ
jgi:hypothetical protein